MSSSLDNYPSISSNSRANEVLEEEMKAEYHLCINRPEEYRKKVDTISDLFHLNTAKGNRLKSNDCPIYIVGHSNEYILVGLNPGYSAINNPVEEMEARKSWEHYLDFYQYKFFKFFNAKKFESPYYKSLYLLLSNLSNSQELNLWQFFDSHTINLELVPYHSEGIVFPHPCNTEQTYYLQNRLKITLNYIKRKLTNLKPKLIIFNGKVFHALLIVQNIIKNDNYEWIKITDKFSLYFFKIDNNQCVLFDKFFQSHYWGITDYHRKSLIPNLIKMRLASNT
jgi:hypothetical protein